MKFMCLVILDADLAERMQPADWASMGAESKAYDRSLMDRGVYVHAEALESREAARTVRVRGGQAMTTDGPFMESKEAIAGFILVDVQVSGASTRVRFWQR